MAQPTTSKSQPIDELRRRYDDLNNKRVAAETRLDQTQKALEQLKTEAQEQWGTSDLAELQKKLAKQQADNDSLRQSYEASLAQIETSLKEIETNTSKQK
jgi:chromosome segregation ATPase